MSESPLRAWFDRARGRLPHDDPLPDENRIVRAPGNYFPAGDLVAPRSPGYSAFQSQSSTQENNLLVTLFSAFDAVITLTGTIHRPSNEFTPIGPNGAGFQLQVKGDRALVQFALTVGSSISIASLNAVVSTAAVNIPVNACWCIVQQTRPMNDGSSVAVATLMSGPVTLLQPLAYPGSPIQKTAESTGFTRLLDIAAPAPGQEISISVPNGARWQPTTLHFQLVSNATAGTREVLLRYTSNATATPQTEFTVEAQGTLQGPSQTCQYAYGFTLAPTVSANFGTGASSSTRQTGLPGTRFLLAGESIVTQTAALAVADQYQGIIIGVVEVLDPTAPAGALQPIVTFTGPANGTQNLAINANIAFSLPGLYVVTFNETMTIAGLGAAAGAVGSSNTGVFGGGGGGGGEISDALGNVQVFAGKTYNLRVGNGVFGGNGDTSLVNVTDAITLFLLKGGTNGGGINSGIGGTGGTGASRVAGSNGGVGGQNGGGLPSSPGANNPTGAAGGGGGGDSAGPDPGANGGTGRNEAGQAAPGSHGGFGGGVTFTGVPGGPFGGGGGGAAGAAGQGGPGENGLLRLSLVSAP